MHLFYCPDITPGPYTLPEEESKHCIRVLRLKTGDVVHITDGRGNLHECRITEDHPKRCTVGIVSTQHSPAKSDSRIHIAIAPTKNIERFEWFLEKATEIGIDEITPLYCGHSERTVLKPGRLEKVIVAAMKQSLRSWLPVLHHSADFEKFIGTPLDGQKFIAYCGTGREQHLQDLYKPGSGATVLIGPEGDFTPAEVEQAISEGYVPVSLGSGRLRTETAGVVACVMLTL